MPLPWVVVFLMIFFCMFFLGVWASSFYLYSKSGSLSSAIKSVFVVIPW